MRNSFLKANKVQRRRVSILLLLAGALCLQLGYGFLDHAPDYDEAYYMDLARGITRSGIPQPRPDAQIFLSHPSLFYYLESVLFLAGEPPLIVARLLSTVFSLLSLWVLFHLVEHVWGRRRAWVASCLLAINPCFIYYSHSVYMESTVTFFSLLGLSWWLRASEEIQRGGDALHSGMAGQPRPARVAFRAGLSLGVAFLAKYLGGLYVLGIVIRQIISARQKILSHRLFWLFLAGVFLVSLLWPVYASSVSMDRFLAGFQFWFSQREPLATSASWRATGFLMFCVYAVGVLTPAFVLLVLVGLIREGFLIMNRRASSRTREFFFSSVTILGVFLFFFLSISQRDIKYLAVILPLLAVFAAAPIDRLLDGKRKWVPVLLAVCLIFSVGPGAYLYDPVGNVWRPNLVVFGLQRDGRYVDLMVMGRIVRAERNPGDRLLAEAKNSLLGYYGDIEAKSGSGLRWEKLSGRLARTDYYLESSDAPELPANEASQKDRMLAEDFIELKRARRGDIVQVLYRRGSAPGSGS